MPDHVAGIGVEVLTVAYRPIMGIVERALGRETPVREIQPRPV